MARASVLLAASAMGMFACSAGSVMCNSFTTVPPTITVTDSVSGQPICDATVTVLSGPDYVATDGGDEAAEALTVLSSDGGAPVCTYVGAAIVEYGTYTIQASKSGFQTVTVQDVQVRSDSCEADEQPGPSSQQVDISLAPD
jgi:hypothetical protein